METLHRFAVEACGKADMEAPVVELGGVLPYSPEALYITLEDGSVWDVALDELRSALVPRLPKLPAEEVEKQLEQAAQKYMLLTNGRWLHDSTDNLYWVICLSFDCASHALLVTYRLHGTRATFTRPLAEFVEKFRLDKGRVDG